MKKSLPLLWIVATALLYVMSSGPVWCLVRKMSHPVDTMRTIYYPLTFLGDTGEDLLERYVSLWADPIF